jgi:indolepyruvate ferredoxin oxidoreductase beta subunit
MPYTVASGESSYPEMQQILERLGQLVGRVAVLDADELAQRAGNPQCANVVMLGALFGTGHMPLQPQTIRELIQQRFAARIAEINLQAFELGIQAVAK